MHSLGKRKSDLNWFIVQVTRAADYAVRVMIHLAGMPPGRRASQPQLAEAAECPPPFLSKVLQRLTRAGLVISHRGNAGGFELPQAQRRATLLEIVEAIDGPILLNICLSPDTPCGRSNGCQAHRVWAKAQTALREVLGAAVIEEMAGGSQWN